MRCLRTSGLPALILALVMGFGVFLPEAGHSLAHRQGGLHGSHHIAGHIEADHGIGAVVSSNHVADDHPHLDLLAAPPGKPLFAYAIAAQAILWLLSDFDEGRRLTPAVARALTPIQNGHGPPPPTRAPPHI